MINEQQFSEVFKKKCIVCQKEYPESDFEDTDCDVCSSCDADGSWLSDRIFEDAGGHLHLI